MKTTNLASFISLNLIDQRGRPPRFYKINMTSHFTTVKNMPAMLLSQALWGQEKRWGQDCLKQRVVKLVRVEHRLSHSLGQLSIPRRAARPSICRCQHRQLERP